MPFNAGSSPVASNASLVSPFGDTSKLPHDSKQNDIVASAMITWLIGALFLAARCYTKLTINRNRLGASEWTLLAAVISSLGVSVAIIMEAEFGMGAHIYDLTPANSNLIKATEAMWISLVFYATSLSLSKLSILLLYITLFYHTWVRRASYAILVVLFLSQVWVYYVIFTACTPLAAFWDTSIVPLDCHSQSYFLSNQYLLIATDFLTFFLPIPVVWKLKVRIGQKCLLFALFAMGFFVCTISVVRITLLAPTLANPGPDPTYVQAPIFHWTLVETNLAIVVACAMTLKPLISHFMPRMLTTHPYKEAPSTSSPSAGYVTWGGSGAAAAAARVGGLHPPLPTGANHIRVDSSFTAEIGLPDEEMVERERRRQQWPFGTEGNPATVSEVESTKV